MWTILPRKGTQTRTQDPDRPLCLLTLDLHFHLGLRALLVYSYTRILFAVILFLVIGWCLSSRWFTQPTTFSFILHPFYLGMLDDLVQYCLTEIAYEGELGTRLVCLDRTRHPNPSRGRFEPLHDRLLNVDQDAPSLVSRSW